MNMLERLDNSLFYLTKKCSCNIILLDSDNMKKYIDGFLDCLKLEKNYSDNTIGVDSGIVPGGL